MATSSPRRVSVLQQLTWTCGGWSGTGITFFSEYLPIPLSVVIPLLHAPYISTKTDRIDCHDKGINLTPHLHLVLGWSAKRLNMEVSGQHTLRPLYLEVNNPRYPQNRRLVDPLGAVLLLSGFEPRFLRLPPCSLVAIESTLFTDG